MPWNSCDAAEADDRRSSTLKLVAFDKPTALSLLHQRSTLDGMEKPQQLSSRAIEEFKDLYLEEFGELLSNAEAQEVALRLLRFLQMLEPLPGAGRR
jgi:phage terminase large subunit